MKKLISLFSALVFFTLITTLAHAQKTISKTDFENLFEPLNRVTPIRIGNPLAFPSHISIVTVNEDGSRVYRCGGTIIDNEHVVTAAHCILDKDTHHPYKWASKMFYVLAGTSSINDTILNNHQKLGALYEVHNYRYHENYPILVRDEETAKVTLDIDMKFDIALLKLGKKIETNDSVKPALIASDSVKNTYLQAFTLLSLPGYGETEFQRLSNELRVNYMPFVPSKECGSQRAWGKYYNENFLCYGVPGAGNLSGPGDSGSGVYIKDEKNNTFNLVAVHTIGPTSNYTTDSVFYKYSMGIDISKFKDWIVATKSAMSQE